MTAKIEQTIPYQITVPPGTELDSGYHEDGEPLIVNVPTDISVVGAPKNGALPVRRILDGKPIEEILFFHQPEPRSTKI